MDDIEQRIRAMQNIRSIGVFIPKKISFNNEWLNHLPKKCVRIDLRRIKKEEGII